MACLALNRRLFSTSSSQAEEPLGAKRKQISVDPMHVLWVKLLTLAEKGAEKAEISTPPSSHVQKLSSSLSRLFPIDKIHIFIRSDFAPWASGKGWVDEGKLSERTEGMKKKRFWSKQNNKFSEKRSSSLELVIFINNQIFLLALALKTKTTTDESVVRRGCELMEILIYDKFEEDSIELFVGLDLSIVIEKLRAWKWNFKAFQLKQLQEQNLNRNRRKRFFETDKF